MLKLTLRQQLRIFIWKHQRSLLVAISLLLAALLMLLSNDLLQPELTSHMFLTLAQLTAGALVVLLVLVLCD
ncbi:MAG: hypothetical protein ACK4NN_15280 [Rheinheimera sp.]